MIKIERPKRWEIKVWEDNGIWHQEYMEFFDNNKENIEAMARTIPIVTSVLKYQGLKKIEEIKKDGMIGILMKTETDKLAFIANQIIGEFLLMSEFGTIKLIDIFKLAILFMGTNISKEQDSEIIKKELEEISNELNDLPDHL